jgi:hypothetical protein
MRCLVVVTGVTNAAAEEVESRRDAVGVATRWVVRTVVMLAAITLCVTMAREPTRMTWWWSVALGGSAVGFAFFATGRGRRYLSPLLFTVFFTLGFVVVFSQLLTRRDAIPPIGFGSVGAFDFTDAAFLPAALAIGAGLVGLAAGALAGEAMLADVRGRNHARARALDPRLVWGWFGAGALVIVISFYLGVGRTGIDNAVVLPGRITGILVIGKTYLIPAVGALLLNVALHREDRAVVAVLLGQLLVLGVATSITSLSRGSIVYCVVAPIMFLISHGRRAPWARWLAVRFALVAVVAMVMVVSLVKDLRAVAFEGRGFSAEQSIEVVSRREGVVDEAAVQGFFELAAERTGGMRELLAVSNAEDVHKVGATAALFFGDEFEIERLTGAVFGFIPENSGGVAFGLGFGMWGMLAASGSLVVVLLGSMLVMLFLVTIEHLFARRGQAGAGFMVSSLVGFRLWGQPLLGEVVRFLFVIAFAQAMLWWLLARGEPGVALVRAPEPSRPQAPSGR